MIPARNNLKEPTQVWQGNTGERPGTKEEEQCHEDIKIWRAMEQQVRGIIFEDDSIFLYEFPPKCNVNISLANLWALQSSKLYSLSL